MQLVAADVGIGEARLHPQHPVRFSEEGNAVGKAPLIFVAIITAPTDADISGYH